MKKGTFFFLSAACLLFIAQGCKNKQPANVSPSVTETSDTVQFYPIADFFRNQLKQVDSGATHIYKITVSGAAKDSSTLTRDQFNLLAQVFLQDDISDKSVHKYYKQNIFFDETTRSYTFNYTTMKAGLPLQSMDILLDEGDQHVKRVFINKFKTAGDSSITEKCGWKAGSSFFINKIIDLPGNKTITEQNMIVWQNQP